MVKRRMSEEEETFKGRETVDRLEMNEMRENGVVKNDICLSYLLLCNKPPEMYRHTTTTILSHGWIL